MTVANVDVSLYGLLGITHGFARILTILSEDTSTGWFSRLYVPPDEFDIVEGIDEQQPVQLHERVDGAIGRFIQRHNVRVLDNAQWMQMKQRRVQ